MKTKDKTNKFYYNGKIANGWIQFNCHEKSFSEKGFKYFFRNGVLIEIKEICTTTQK